MKHRAASATAELLVEVNTDVTTLTVTHCGARND